MKLESTIYPDNDSVRAEICILDLGEYPLSNKVFDRDGVCQLLSGCGVGARDLGSMGYFAFNVSYSNRAISCHDTLGGAKQWVSDTVLEVERQYNEWLSLRQVHEMEPVKLDNNATDPDWDTLRNSLKLANITIENESDDANSEFDVMDRVRQVIEDKIEYCRNHAMICYSAGHFDGGDNYKAKVDELSELLSTIMAASDLLEAVEVAFGEFMEWNLGGRYDDTMSVLKQALAKAKGKTVSNDE